MRLRESRILAWSVLAICFFVSVVGLGGFHLHNQRNEALNAFHNIAYSNAERSMNQTLMRAADCVRVMAYEGQCYLGKDHAAAKNMLDNLAFFGEEHPLDDRYAAYTQLRRDSEALYNAMYSKPLLDGERVNFKRAYDDFWRCDQYIRRSPYRELAARYNKIIAVFPANAVASIVGAGELNSFGA